MHSDLQPDGSGRTRAVRARATRHAFSFLASVALIAAAVVTISAPSASASGSDGGITSCTSYDAHPFQQPGERHREIFVPRGITQSVFIIPDGLSNGFFYWWEVQTVNGVVVAGPNSNVVKKMAWNALGYNFNLPNDSTREGTVQVFELSRIANFDDTAAPYGTGPFGDPLCSVTLVFADADGNDPRPAPPAPLAETPISAPVPAVSCSPMPAAAGATVTCTVTGGEPGIDILWRASYNPVITEAGVTLGADGTGTFSFVVPAAARGQEVMVELVEWTAPMSLGTTVGGVVPTSVPAGEGREVPAGSLAVTVALALVAGMVARRRAADLVD
jgi:hypothetical protein